MFNCELCGKTSKPRERRHTVIVVEKMTVHAPVTRLEGRGEYREEKTYPGGRGMQIVNAVHTCVKCSDKLVKNGAREV